MAGDNPSWDPQRYLLHVDHRLRPAMDLIMRIPEFNPQYVVDLGCGPGRATALLRERWANAEIVGVDGSPEMLVEAREVCKNVTFIEAEIDEWEPEVEVDLVFSNATLHWLPEHGELLPELLSWVRPGGILAIQVPQTRHGNWRDVARTVARQGPWAVRLRALMGPGNVLTPRSYYRVLNGETSLLDIWETTYLHRLEGEDPVLSWTQGAGLRPFLDVLSPTEQEAFLQAYNKRLRMAYPPEQENVTLFPFRRVFLIAQRRED